MRKVGYKRCEELYRGKHFMGHDQLDGRYNFGYSNSQNDSKLNFIKAMRDIFPGQWGFS